MTPVCGFKDYQGKFWDTEDECVLANKIIEELNIKREFDNIKYKLFEALNDTSNGQLYYEYNHMSRYRKETIAEACELLLANSKLTKEYFEKMARFVEIQKRPEQFIPKANYAWWKFW